MRSQRCVRAPSRIITLLTLVLSISPLATSNSVPHIWSRDGGSSQKNAPAIDTGKESGFQFIGHVDTHSSDPYNDDDNGGNDDEEPAIPTPSSLADQSQSEPGPDTLNTTSLGNDAMSSTCSTLQSWYVPNFDMVREDFIRDCYLAVQRLFIDEVYFNSKSNVRMEFAAPPSSNGLPAGFKHTTSWDDQDHAQTTPIMIESNTCTLAVTMLSTFVNMTGGTTTQLPGNFKQVSSLRSSDTTSFRALHKAGRMVENDCLRRYGKAGWIAVGTSYILVLLPQILIPTNQITITFVNTTLLARKTC